MSAIKEQLNLFYEEYICLNLKSYENIGIDIEIVKLFLMAALAVIVCGIILDYHHKYTYALIKQLLRHDATSEGAAKSLSELGLSSVTAIKKALVTSGKLTSMVARVGEAKMTYEEYMKKQDEYKLAKKKDKSVKESDFFGGEVDFSEARFYIREENKGAALRIFNGADVSALRTVLRSVFIVLISVIVVVLMPEFFGWINGILG